jgi:endonuclease YncB( thermonuclease family)
MFNEYMSHYDGGPTGWSPPFEYRVLAARVVDGDTVDLVVDVGFRQLLEDRFRLGEDFDAWERKRPTLEEGNAARDRLAELLRQAQGLKVRTEKDSRQRALRGKFGRYIAVLYAYIPERGEGWTDVAAILRDEGHAKAEEGASDDASQ